MKKHYPTIAAVLVGLASSVSADPCDCVDDNAIRFTSAPDIFNWNISNPQPGWEETLDWFFTRLDAEGPDFHLNAGDIMDARWWKSPEQVVTKTEEYWPGWKERYEERGMTVYLAPGDHEYGDDGGLKRGDIARAFGEQLTKMMGMPMNGPETNLGRAFWVREENLLVVTLDTFVDRGDHFGYTVGPEQLAWFDEVLSEHADADFVIVQGHLPIIGPVRSENSSASMLEDGTDSDLWKVMVKHSVDVYLTGEHHRITVSHQDGVWQVVHGALWGTQTDLNYLRGVVTDDTLTLELVEFDVRYSGDYIQDHPHRAKTNKPRENVMLTNYTKVNGPRTSGRLVVREDAIGGKYVDEATGWFNLK